ncbi:MAG: polysaccharide biosynthesis C-terminal domain-containing protein [Ruminococcus sp.]|nr:polysaccharide biosynthesis C-terminal domain-containing protein [Ruminococcus sp.]
MQGRSIKKDTVRLTIVQFALEFMSLGANLWLSQKAGSAAMGMIALVGSFFGLASMAAGGNGYLCASRFVSEELGKMSGNPEKILRYVIMFSLILGIPGCILIVCFSPYIAEYFFHSSEMTLTVCILGIILPFGGISACMKGWCNAVCRVKLTAFCDFSEFIVKMTVLTVYILRTNTTDSGSLCRALALSMASGTFVSLFILTLDFLMHRMKSLERVSLSFSGYIKLAMPVILGGCLTSALSTANDALIPVTLRQSGSTAEAALSQFGIFEAIVIPVLFFPTSVLCVLSGLLIPEAARAEAGAKKERLRYLTKRSLKFTIYFSFFIASSLIIFGENIAVMFHGDILAGKMLRLLAPVIPFIYLEIILEAIIKGMGKQQFSMINYLAEYAVRITAVLVLIPIIGFYGIVVSYYASNIFGNCMRLIKTFKITGLRPNWTELLICPFVGAAAAFYLPYTILQLLGIVLFDTLIGSLLYIFLSAIIYIIITLSFSNSNHNIFKRKLNRTAEVIK